MPDERHEEPGALEKERELREEERKIREREPHKSGDDDPDGPAPPGSIPTSGPQ